MINALALTDKNYQAATLKVAPEADLWVFPPMLASYLMPEHLEGYDLIYIDLHGQPGSVYLYCGESQLAAAINLDCVREADLRGTAVFMTTCYGPETPFVEGFLAAGATAVAAGRGENWGTRTSLTGAQLLGKFFLEEYEQSGDAKGALEQAKKLMRLNLKNYIHPEYWKAARDAFEFQVFEKDHGPRRRP